MMDCTDRHDRFFLRLISKNVMLYTEMVATKSAIHGDRKKILSFSPEEKPLALQVGGSNKEELAEVRSLVEEIKQMIEKKEEMSEVEEQVKEELSETPATEAITHNPEPKQKVSLKYAQNRKQSTFDKVMSKIVNN